VWFFAFSKNRRFWVFQKNSESKELAGFLVFKTQQNQRTVGSGYFKNP
jgi:hypothetical protein